jgi:beta-glucanase (GH16 family)
MKNRAIIILSCAALLISCGEAPTKEKETPASEVSPKTNEVRVNFADYENSDPLSGWYAYTIDVPVAGRYRVEFTVKSDNDTSYVWIEDHIDNKDDRTYNITSNIPVPASNEYTVVSRDGSPMNVGQHKIKLHVIGNADVEKVNFSLMKAHQNTPLTLTQNWEGDEWDLVWSDEFDGEGLPDTTKWTFDIGNWGWGNGELQYYTENRLKNARLEDGNLLIEAHKNDMGEKWTSARLTTRGKTSFLYGKIEFRAKVPAEKGNWAAGWTLGDEYVDELSWPYCGEIDILESVGYQMDNVTGNGTAHASAHSGAYYFKLGNQPTATTPVENMNNSFHTYAVEWGPEGMTATVDGKPYFTYDDTSSELSWPFDKPQNIILTLAMGGGWGGLEGMDDTVQTQLMTIDYVRVYQKK